MNYCWIDDIKKFQDISKEWDKVLFSSKEDNPFLLSDFILTWWKYYYKNLKLQIFVLYDHAKIVGGLPLCQNKNGCLEYPGKIAANYTEFLFLKNDIRLWGAFFHALTEKQDWRYIQLKRYRKNRLNAHRDELVQLGKDNNLLLDMFTSEYAYLINIPEEFVGYLSRLPKKLRYYIRRSEEEFAKLGKVSLYFIKNSNEVDALSQRYIALSRDSFKKRNRQSAFEDERFCQFFRDLISKFYRAGYLDAHVLKLNDRAVAIHFGYSIGNNLNYVFPVFDIEFSRLNPGHLLIYKLLELGSKRKNKLFDLYTGGHLYKEQWSDQKEEIVTITVRRDCIRSRIEQKVSQKLRGSLIIKKITQIGRSSSIAVNLGKRIRGVIGNRA